MIGDAVIAEVDLIFVGARGVVIPVNEVAADETLLSEIEGVSLRISPIRGAPARRGVAINGIGRGMAALH